MVSVKDKPTPQELSSLYAMEAGYFASARKDLSAHSPDKAQRVHDRLIASGVRGRSFLDVGCGTGGLMYHLMRFGWKVAGFDINKDAVKIATANGLRAWHSTIEHSVDLHETFDVVNLGDVLEHVGSPGIVLDSIRQYLGPYGVMMIRTPDSQCGFALVPKQAKIAHAALGLWPGAAST